MSLQSAIASVILAASELNLVGGISEPHGFSGNPAITALTDGTGADKAQKCAQQILTLSTTPTDLDLTAFAGGPNNVAINFSKPKWIFMQNLDVTNGITVGAVAGTPVNAWTNFVNGTFPLPAKAVVPWYNGFVGWVVGGANKLLRVVAVAGTPQLVLYIVGEGA